MDLFLASKEARRDGWEGGLTGEGTGGEEAGMAGEWWMGGGGGSARFLGSSVKFSFLEEMEMHWMVVRWAMDGGGLAVQETEEWIENE